MSVGVMFVRGHVRLGYVREGLCPYRKFFQSLLCIQHVRRLSQNKSHPKFG